MSAVLHSDRSEKPEEEGAHSMGQNNSEDTARSKRLVIDVISSSTSSSSLIRHQSMGSSHTSSLSDPVSNSGDERLRGCESARGVKSYEELGRCGVKMPANKAESLSAISPHVVRTSSAGVRIHVPKSNAGDLTKLTDALKVANDMFKEGKISNSAYEEMCFGIQGKMEELVCVWVTPSP